MRDGAVGRGIQYPFKPPGVGEYHAPWDGDQLEPWKEAMRHLFAFHARDREARLGQVSTEFIPGPITAWVASIRYSIRLSPASSGCGRRVGAEPPIEAAALWFISPC